MQSLSEIIAYLCSRLEFSSHDTCPDFDPVIDLELVLICVKCLHKISISFTYQEVFKWWVS